MNAVAATTALLAIAGFLLSCASPMSRDDAEQCSAFEPGVVSGKLESPRILEASGLAASQRNAGVYWLHNDSGDGALLYASDLEGRDLGIFTLVGRLPVDIEDIAVGPAEGLPGSFVYLADIGDNPESRTHVEIYRVPEPAIESTMPGGVARADGAVAIPLQYPGGASHDAEAFFVDPQNADFYIVTKREARVFRLHGAAASPRVEPHVLEEVGRLALGRSLLPGASLVTAADIDFEGNQIALRTYSRVLMWSRVAGQSIADAFRSPPCSAPTRRERQGEAIAFAHDSQGYLTVSEGRHPPLHFFSSPTPRP